MKSFLIIYNRLSGKVDVQEFAVPSEAIQARMAYEIHCKPDEEVVVLRSNSLDSVKRTHSRYFHTVPELLRAIADSLRQVTAAK
jgi:hypothetical protein